MTDPTLRRRMVDAAQAWLASLDDDQRADAAWPFPSQERRRWFYTPTDHGGLPLLRMRPAQQGLAMQLLATGLSRAGYGTASSVSGAAGVVLHRARAPPHRGTLWRAVLDAYTCTPRAATRSARAGSR